DATVSTRSVAPAVLRTATFRREELVRRPQVLRTATFRREETLCPPQVLRTAMFRKEETVCPPQSCRPQVLRTAMFRKEETLCRPQAPPAWAVNWSVRAGVRRVSHWGSSQKDGGADGTRIVSSAL